MMILIVINYLVKIRSLQFTNDLSSEMLGLNAFCDAVSSEISTQFNNIDGCLKNQKHYSYCIRHKLIKSKTENKLKSISKYI